MASGVGIPDEVISSYSRDLKMDKKHKFIIYKFRDDWKEIEIERRSAKDATYDDLCAELAAAEAKGECRYAVYDMHYETDRGAPKDKIIFFSWAPDSAKVKPKMLHASSKDAFKKKLGDGIAKEIQASDYSELKMEDVIKELKNLDRN